MKDEMTLNGLFNISVTVKRLGDKCLQINVENVYLKACSGQQND